MGHYTRLDGVFRSCLRQLGEDEDADEDWSADLGQSPSPFRAPLLYFDFVEICGGAGVVSRSAASLGLVVAPTLDISESVHYDLKDLMLLEWIMHMIESSPFQELPCRASVYELFSCGFSNGSILPGSSWILPNPSQNA